MAQAMVNKVATEVNYAKNLSSSTVSGLNFGSMSNLATPTTTAGGQPYQYYIDQQSVANGGTLSVQQQMGDYLQSIQSFQGDVGTLSKGGLNKTLLKQLLAAGPVQGDAEAQSILSGAGGVKGANSLYNQIQAASNKLGIAGGQAVYGYGQGKTVQAGAKVTGTAQVHQLQSAISSLHGKTVTIKVNVDAGGGSSGTSIDQIVAQVEKKFLQQAKRNRKTGLQLQGYGS